MLRIFYMEIFPFVRINQWDLSSLNSEPVIKYMGISLLGTLAQVKKEVCHHELSGTLGFVQLGAGTGTYSTGGKNPN